MKPVPKPCKTCRRPTINTNGYCDQHHSDFVPTRLRYDRFRGSPSKRGYDRTWYKFREVFMMEHPLCAQCEKEGRITPATEVHHILPLCEGGARLDPANCMSLCHSCHSKITAEWMNRK